MSGSSLDGLDIADCTLHFADDGRVEWKMHHSATYPYEPRWQLRLRHLHRETAFNFAKTHTYFSHYIAEMIEEFVEQHDLSPDFIATHGHTIFHHPDKRLTVQIGDGGALAAKTGYPVICNFRAHDIAINGEGAPVAPIADKLLFPDYDLYLNLGGIVNISANIDGRFVAYDVAPANQLLNALAETRELPYDDDGAIARAGTLQPELFDKLNRNFYYGMPYPKSLANQYISAKMYPVVERYPASLEDRMATSCHHIAHQICTAVDEIRKREQFERKSYRMFVTGGGAFNGFLMEMIQQYCAEANIEVTIPPPEVIGFKESLLMALMGAMRLNNMPNVLSDVTGAERDTISGAVYQGWRKQV